MKKDNEKRISMSDICINLDFIEIKPKNIKQKIHYNVTEDFLTLTKPRKKEKKVKQKRKMKRKI